MPHKPRWHPAMGQKAETPVLSALRALVDHPWVPGGHGTGQADNGLRSPCPYGWGGQDIVWQSQLGAWDMCQAGEAAQQGADHWHPLPAASLVPQHRGLIASLVLRALLTGICVSMLNACLAGRSLTTSSGARRTWGGTGKRLKPPSKAGAGTAGGQLGLSSPWLCHGCKPSTLPLWLCHELPRPKTLLGLLILTWGHVKGSFCSTACSCLWGDCMGPASTVPGPGPALKHS